MFEESITAYKKLIDYYGGDRDNANYIIHLVMNGLFLGQRSLVNKAYDAILNNDEERFKQTIAKYLLSSD